MGSGDDGMERAYWLAWSAVEGVGAAGIKQLHEHFGSLAAAWRASPAALSEVLYWSGQRAELVAPRRQGLDPAAVLAHWEARWPPFWTPADPGYPPLLAEIADPPPVLFAEGSLAGKPWPPAVAIVGTRRPSPHGLTWAARLADALARAGFLVVSGLAYGIDAAAHHHALEAGGPTVAVLGGSTREIYPAFHRPLAARTRACGALLSEHPPGTRIESHHFPKRNRILVGLCQATIVVEAPERSGALISAQLACEYGRDVYVLPASPDLPEARGCLKLLAQGASPILSLEELLVALQGTPLPSRRSAAPPTFEAGEEPVWECLRGVTLGFDELAERTGLSSTELATALLTLEMKGTLTRHPDGRYALA